LKTDTVETSRSTSLQQLLAVVLLTQGVNAMAIEEPDFDVLASYDTYEVRRYSPYLVAEVDVVGDGSDSRAFRILAGYIFGDNQKSEKMQMTAPVETREQPSGEKMSMTAPVISATANDASATYAFVMEQKYTLDALPRPNDERIRLLERPERVVAVRRYAGGWSEAKYAENKKALLDALARDNLSITGAAEFARYDSPFKPWFLRRNEIWVPIKWANQNQANHTASRSGSR
jgi:hypothetical protein